MSVLITKADGLSEPFNPSKLIESLTRAGAPLNVAEEVEREISGELRAGMTTQELYRRAFASLRDHRKEVAARYSLKRAILEFGPSGFPFEEYLAQLFVAEGCSALTDQIIKGACVEHEVDVVVQKNGTTTYVEAKFHNNAGYKTDLKVALYVKARLEDIIAHERSRGSKQVQRGLLVTNTKFTSQARHYASCAGLELLGWEEPERMTLRDRIDKVSLYPITALTSLSHRQKMALLGQKVVLCKELAGRVEALEKAGVSGSRVEEALSEARALCASGEGLQ